MRNFLTVKYRIEKFGDVFFISNDMGRFCVLTEKEYDLFRKDCFTPESERKLLDSFIILDASNVVQALELLNKRNNAITAGTSLHIIVVTLRCNVSCVYCQVGRKFCDKEGYDMDEETARATVDRIFETTNDTITIEFQGGEPTLNWDIVQFIIEYAEEKNKEANKNMEISMVTNMTTMDYPKMIYLINHNVDVCTSLDGPAIVHNTNRVYTDGNTYLQTVNWIKRFNEEYKSRKLNRRMSALVTLTRHSLSYMKEIVDQYVELGIEVIHLRKLTKLGFAKAAWDRISYSVEEYLNFWKQAVEYIEKLKAQGKFINSRIVLMLEQKLMDDADPNYFDLRSPCGAAIGQIAYNFDGKIYFCDEARMIKDEKFCLGDVKTSHYEDYSKSQKCFDCVTASTITQYDCCDNCVFSPFCGNCPVLNYAEKGTMYINPEETDNCKIFKAQFEWVVKRYFLG